MADVTALGIDVRGTNTKLGLVNSSGGIRALRRFPTDAHGDVDEARTGPACSSGCRGCAKALCGAPGIERLARQQAGREVTAYEVISAARVMIPPPAQDISRANPGIAVGDLSAGEDSADRRNCGSWRGALGRLPSAI